MSLSSDSLADLDAMLADHNVVVCGTVTNYGILDESATFGTDEGGVTIQVRATTLLVKTGRFPAIAAFALLTVDGTQFQVRDFALEDDGKLTRVMLARTTT